MSEWYLDLPAKDVKNYIKSNINDAARGFVSIGFYLKQARDRELYKEDGYSSFAEYAQQEFGISYSYAIKLMQINDKFSKGGNSPILLDQYKEYSSSKLSEMLTLTDAQMEQVTPQSTVKEIRGLKQQKKKHEEPKVEKPKEEIPKEEPTLESESIATSQQEDWLIDIRRHCLFNKNQQCNFKNVRDVASSCGIECKYTCCYSCDNVDCGARCNQSNTGNVHKQDIATSRKTPIDDLDLSVSTYNNLRRDGISTVEELRNMSDTELMSIRGFGYRSFNEVKKAINEMDTIDVEAHEVTEVSESVNKPSEIVTKEPESVIKEQKNDYKDLTSWINSNGKVQYAQIKDVIWNTFTNTNTNSMDKLAEVLANRLSIWVLDQSRGYRDYLMHCDISSADIHSESKLVEQPELPTLKNNDQRKEWIEQYRSWPLWFETKQTGERFFRYDFEDGSSFVIKESLSHVFEKYKPTDKTDYGHKEYYHIGKSVDWNGWNIKDRTFYESATNLSLMVEYLKEIQKGAK